MKSQPLDGEVISPDTYMADKDMTASEGCKKGSHVARRELGKCDGEGVNITAQS